MHSLAGQLSARRLARARERQPTRQESVIVEERPASDDLDMIKYTSPDALRAFVLSGDVQFVKASYILSLAQQGMRFQRRQDVSEECCADQATIERWIGEIEASIALRNEFTSAARSDFVEFRLGMRFPPFVIVSYAWLNAEHPDPDGLQLNHVLAPFVEWYMSERARYISADVQDRAFGVRAVTQTPAGSRARLAAPFTAEGVDFGIFLDFSSIWQKERSASQEASFRCALQSMDLLYAHQETVVVRMTRSFLDGIKPYNERGWPFFETSASQYIKPTFHCLDLGREQAVAALDKFSGEIKSPEELAAQGMYRNRDYPGGTLRALKDRRLPPLVPEEFAARAQTKTLTNGKDMEILLKLQEEVSLRVLSNVEELNFSQLLWGDLEMKLLAKALQMCRKLRTLDLSHNKQITQVGAQLLATCVSSSPSLQTLSLYGALALNDAGAIAICEAIQQNTQTQLASLNLFNTGISDVTGKALVATLADTPTLMKVNVSGFHNKLGEAGKAALMDIVKDRKDFELKL